MGMAINDEQTDRSSSNYLGRPEELEMSEKDHTMAGNSAETSDNESSEGLLRKEERDLEAQSHAAPAVEHTVSPKKKLLFLAAWFFFNLALTISNKAVLGKAKFPWLLTTLHASATSIGCFGLMGLGMVKLTALSTRENLILLAFSVLFTVNIAISNVSLAMVSVPLHQIMRSTCPVVTILIYRTLYNRSYSTPTYLSMIPLIFGVGLATAGDYYCTLIGFLLTALGVILAAVKTVATNRLMTGSVALCRSAVRTLRLHHGRSAGIPPRISARPILWLLWHGATRKCGHCFQPEHGLIPGQQTGRSAYNDGGWQCQAGSD